jgi:AcrR family transcriptional regulator
MVCQYAGDMATKAGQYGGRSAAERAADRRERLLDAALEVWGRDGGPRVTMTRICAEAGLTERYFYQEFANLDAALVAVMDRVAVEIEERGRAAVDATAGGPADRIRAAVRTFVEILTDDPRKGRVAIVESVALDGVRPRRAELMRLFAHLAADEAAALYPEQAWTAQEREMVGLLFIGGVAQLVTGWLDGTLSATPDEIVEAATHAFTAIAHR